jgi:hypothetical protein
MLQNVNPRLNRYPRLIGDLELHWPPGFLLDYSRSVSHAPSNADIVQTYSDEITPAQLAVDRQIEHCEIAFAFLQLEADTNRPDLFRLQGPLLTDDPTLIPGLASFTKSA